MKTNKLFILLGILGLLVSHIGCKKGENDPTLSLRSRKARLVGKWVFEEGSMTLNQNSRYSYIGPGYTQTGSQTSISTSNFSSGSLMETYS